MSPNSLNPVSADEDDHRPRHIYYTHETPTLEPELADALFNASSKILIANSWPELIDHLQYNPKSICVNAKNFEGISSFAEILSMIKTFAKITHKGDGDGMTVTLGVNADTPYKIIKEAQMSGLLGMVPNNTFFGWRETVKGLEAQWAGMTYWPKHIIDQLPGAKKPKQPTTTGIKLTHRQQQIFDIVMSRGCSNKHIARLLGLSESTVKLHMGAIFKKYGVNNRTQLAVFSKTSN